MPQEEASVMTLLNDDVGDRGTIIDVQLLTGLVDAAELFPEGGQEFALGDAVTEDDDVGRLSSAVLLQGNVVSLCSRQSKGTLKKCTRRSRTGSTM